MSETAVVLNCIGERMVGIHHSGAESAVVGVVIAIGGPQYRAGSHRQFVLMARVLANAGIPVLRFDYRGMGDSEGSIRSFESVTADIRSAVDQFASVQPTITKFVLLGLCDAASASMMYAHEDERVHGLVLINPWVRTEQSEAKAYIEHYYLRRLLQKTFWKKLFSGELEVFKSIAEFTTAFRESRRSSDDRAGSEISTRHFIDHMQSGLAAFSRPVLLLISGRDLTAQEFVDLCAEDEHWKNCVERSNFMTKRFPDADHTMSLRDHLDDASSQVARWVLDLP